MYYQDPLPYSIGEVLAIEGATITLKITSAFPAIDGAPIWCMVNCDPKTLRMGPAWSYGSSSPLRRLDTGIFQTTDKRVADQVSAGCWLVMQHIGIYSPGVGINECEEFRFENFTFHSLPGMGVIAHRSSDLSFRQFKAFPAPGRVRSINRDATHFINCTGLIDFEDCLFDSMGDDAVNVHGFYYTTHQRLDDRTLVAIAGREPQTRRWDWPDAGDRVEFVKRINLLPYAERDIESVSLDVEQKYFTVRFAEPLPSDYADDDLFGNATRVAKLRFVRCQVKNNCARGVLVQTRDVLIEDCFFENCTGTGIDVNTAANWYESIGTRQVIIRKNHFSGCGGSLGGCGEASGICVRNEADEPAVGIHKDITIQDNVILGTQRRGIFISSTEGLIISGNQIFNSEIGIFLQYVRNGLIHDNTGGNIPVVISSTCQEINGIYSSK